MKSYTKKSRIAIILGIIVSLILSSMTVSYAASGTKKMTAYRVVIKGKYAYCGAHNGIYRVNLYTESKKRIVKENNEGFDFGPCYLKIFKGYLYYLSDGPILSPLSRVKLNGKNKKHLADVYEYAISKGKIYYTSYSFNTDKDIKRVMKLNGKNKKKSRYNVRMKYKDSNKSGYRVEQVLVRTETEYFDEEYYNVIEHYADYFVGPNGEMIKLCSYSTDYLQEW